MDTLTPTRVIIDNKYVKLMYHEDTGIIHHVFGEAMRSEDLRHLLTTGTSLLRSEGATKWLSDNRLSTAHSEEDTAWINTEWLPDAIAAGWKYWALVVPQTFKAQLNMNEFVQAFYDKGVRIMVFTDDAEAMEWLLTVDQ